MNYIVVDFEWNQSSYGRRVNPHIPFEIIEIGAVMLDEDLQEIDRYSATVRPKVYKKLHFMTRDLTGITQEELDRSDPFPYVLVDFMLWCGDDSVFCTWGGNDLVELQRNMKFYHLDDLLEGPFEYYNLQKIFRELCMPNQQAAALETAVDFLHIEKNLPFHRAIHDADYTARVMQKMGAEKIQPLYSVDYYQNPKTVEDEIYVSYDKYAKYVSREFDSHDEAMSDKEVRSTRCIKCGCSARKKIHWFSGKSKTHFCVAFCPEHGYILGKIRFKKPDDQRKCYVVKTLQFINEDEAAAIQNMKKEIVKKRWEKRHHQSASSPDKEDL